MSSVAAPLLDGVPFVIYNFCLCQQDRYDLVPGTAGIGQETVRVLAGAGAKVIMTSRNLAAGQKVATELMQGKGKVRLHIMRLQSLLHRAKSDTVMQTLFVARQAIVLSAYHPFAPHVGFIRLRHVGSSNVWVVTCSQLMHSRCLNV